MKKQNGHASRIRISRGKWRGRYTHFSPLPGLRPTSAKVREAIFSMLAHLADSHGFVDLYSGSGIMALEACSVGFEPVCTYETNRKALQTIAQQAQQLGAQLTYNYKPADQAAEADWPKPIVFFADPPYDQLQLHNQWLEACTPSKWPPECLYVLEAEARQIDTLQHPFPILKSKRYGRTAIHVLKLS